MAKYYLNEEKKSSELIDDVFNNLKSDSTSNTIYAEGIDIDFLSYFLHRISVTTTKLIVRNTDFLNLILDFSASAKIQFQNCAFQNLTLTLNQSCDVIFSQKCKVSKELHISSDLSVSLIHISDSFIESMTLSNLDINQFEISSKSVINTLRYRNSIDKKFGGAIRINGGSKITKGEISNLNINILAIDEATLQNISFENVVVWQRLTLISVNQSKIHFMNFRFGTGIKIIEINTSKDLHLYFYNLSFATSNFQFRYKNNPECVTEINHSFINSSIEFFSSEFETLPHISTIDSVFKELIIFERNSPENLEFHNTIFQNGILIPLNLNKSAKVSAVVKIHSSVWCLLKNQSLESNDKITALTYRKYEMLSYTNEIKKIKGNYPEKFVLGLNRCSNNHGLSWSRGLVFTIAAWLVFYTLYAISANHITVKFDLASALSFLWLPDGLDDLTDALSMSKNWLSSIPMTLFFVLGKIIIGYGIYQTVAAFRKHGQL